MAKVSWLTSGNGSGQDGRPNRRRLARPGAQAGQKGVGPSIRTCPALRIRSTLVMEQSVAPYVDLCQCHPRQPLKKAIRNR